MIFGEHIHDDVFFFRKPSEHFSHANKSWLTVFNIFTSDALHEHTSR